jgi:hypothetical protein
MHADIVYFNKVAPRAAMLLLPSGTSCFSLPALCYLQLFCKLLALCAQLPQSISAICSFFMCL